MEINRNQYFMAGLVVLLLGIQFRYVESFVLNKPCSEYLAKRLKAEKPAAASIPVTETLFGAAAPPPPPALRTIRPPRWLGWALLSVGGVLICHSLAMPRPG